jgi:type VI secretion system protein ImpK
MAQDVIDEITRDCFGAIIQLRALEGAATPDAQTLHGRLCWFVDTMIHRGQELGVPQEDIGDITYGIVALADEVVLGIPALRDFWMYNLLQLRYFNENVAGENFFYRLDLLRNDPRRYPALQVYYLCLLFGFQGRYRVRGGEVELQRITDQLSHDLARFKVIEEETLSPRGGRPPEDTGRARRNLPVVGLSLAAIALALGINLTLHFTLGSSVKGVKERIAALKAR